jgi:lysophospholipase L1-like esterase
LSTSNSDFRGWRRAAAFLLVALIFAVGALELATRTLFFSAWTALSPEFVGVNPTFGVYTLPDLRLRNLSPGNFDVTVTTNHWGFRDPDQGFERRLAGLWVAGDSNTFGEGLDDSDIYTERLNAEGLAVANLGAMGGGFERDFRVMRRMAAAGFRPKAVLQVITLNDTIANLGPELGRLGDQAVPLAATPMPWAALTAKAATLARPQILTLPAIKSMLLRHVALYGWFKTAMTASTRGHALFLASGLIRDVDLVPAGPAWLMERRRAAEVAAQAASMAEYLAAIRDWARDRFDAPYAVALLPAHHDLYPARFAKFARHAGLDAADYDTAQARHLLAAALTARGITVIDCTAALAAADDPALIFPNDGHFNPAGHRIIAQVLEPWARASLEGRR